MPNTNKIGTISYLDYVVGHLKASKIILVIWMKLYQNLIALQQNIRWCCSSTKFCHNWQICHIFCIVINVISQSNIIIGTNLIGIMWFKMKFGERYWNKTFFWHFQVPFTVQVSIIIIWVPKWNLTRDLSLYI